jgi:hypothetical protein
MPKVGSWSPARPAWMLAGKNPAAQGIGAEILLALLCSQIGADSPVPAVGGDAPKRRG